MGLDHLYKETIMTDRRCPRRLFAAGCLGILVSAVAQSAKAAGDNSKALEGLWSGSWGLTIDADGTVHQPVIAELMIKGNRIELLSMPGLARLGGTFTIDSAARAISIFPTSEKETPPAQATIYRYRINADTLTLTDANKQSVEFTRHAAADAPLADAAVEFAVATGISDSGDLLVTKVTALRANRDGATFFESSEQKLMTKQASVFVADESGLKKTTIDNARRLIREPTPIVVAYRNDQRAELRGDALYRLWTANGSADADSAAVMRTISRVLRPGTLVFVLSAQENAPVP
jgi:hypothetical protein